ncbi:MAG: type II toxin-antitoxin system RelE/ParE family toxin [Nitrospiraceae bacterium]
MKAVIWLGSSLGDVRSFPLEAKREIGYQLSKVQGGLEPSDWKAMPSIGPGVREIRVHAGDEYRVIYVAKFQEAVYVLHAFGKKTSKTAQPDLALARQRLQTLVRGRSHR